MLLSRLKVELKGSQLNLLSFQVDQICIVSEFCLIRQIHQEVNLPKQDTIKK